MNEIRIINSNASTKVQIINDLMEIEKAVYEEEYRGEFDPIKARFEKFPEMFILAYDGDKLIGYFCWFPISKSLHDRILTDKALFDDDISPDDVVSIGKDNYVYIISTAILPKYQNNNTGTEMMQRFFQILRANNKKGLKTLDVLTSVISEEGERLVRSNGFIMAEDRVGNGYKLYRLEGDRL